ncbi:MAG TPA: GAF domain-containing protein [Agriterribacter sp.]|nr:GAF domain-containing protein [Agriterribacter sp.]
MKNRITIPILLSACLALQTKAQPAGHSTYRFSENWWWYGCTLLIAAVVVYRIIHSLQQRLKEEKIISAFATTLYGQKTVEDIFWSTAKGCVEKIGLIDCVVYQLDPGRNLLLQKAAFGPKNPWRREIINRIEIPVGKGIVGSVAETGKAEIIYNTAADPRYIVDDERRLSEITVPVWIEGKVFGVIDSEHPRRHFYKKYHLRLLKKIAGICSERIAKYLAEDRLRSKIARDLHDEIGSTLTSINILSKVAMQEGLEEDKIKIYLQKIKDNSGNIMERMSDIVWAVNPVNDSFDKVILRMKEFAAEILESAGINYYFSEEGSLDKTQLNLEQRKDIYLIFKEAVNNAVKYSGATEVNVILQKENDRLKMIIIDNGNGFDTEAAYAGNGIKNMQNRAAGMQSVLKMDAIKGTGTTIALEVIIT